MKVSVVIPTYNRAAFLPEAVESVLKQTFRDFELIIVDDGSTDNTAEIVRTIRDRRIRYISQDNRGVAAALNAGWRAAFGEFIGRLDSDDVWLPTLLQELVSTLDANVSLGLVYARAQWMDARGRVLPQILGAPLRFPGETLKSLLYGDSVCPMAVVFRRECVERAGGYDENLIGNEDWDLWIRMAEHCRFAYRDAILARYRTHSLNLTASGSARFARLVADRVRVLDKFYARATVPAEAQGIKPIAFRNLYQDIAIRNLSVGSWREGHEYFSRALGVSPQPIIFALRFVGVALYYLYLSKTNQGVRLVEALLARRRKTQG
jgi:glycosyltransferase involved in cell wall biosynthesis